MKEPNKTISISLSAILKTLVAIGVAILLYKLLDIVLVVCTSIVLASSIEPFISWFQRRRVPRLLAAIIIFFLTASLFGGLFLFLIPIILGDVSAVIENIPTYAKEVNTIIPLLNQSLLEGYVPILKQLAAQVGQTQFFSEVGGGSVFNSARSIGGGILSVILIFVLSFYFSASENGIEHFLRIVTPLRYEKYVIGLWARTKAKIGAWMQGQILLAVVVGFLVYAVLAIFKIKHALVLGILAAVFELIPVFGPVLSALPGIALTLLDKGVGLALVVTLWYIIVQQLENHLLYPAVVKKIVGISPLIVIIAIVVGAKLAGVLGVILSVPVSVLLVELMDDLDKQKESLRNLN